MYKLSMVSIPIRIGPIMLKMFMIHFKYMYPTLITFEKSNEFVSDKTENAYSAVSVSVFSYSSR